MLVLSRRTNESVVINGDVTVTLIGIRGDKVRLGIVAPQEVPIHRQEEFEAIYGHIVVESVPVAPAPAPAETDDLLPDLIVECRISEAPAGQAKFTPEGGFFFPGRRRS